MLYWTFATTKAAIKFPITPEHISIAQNMLLNYPLLASLAHIDIYWPCATHKIAAPKPLIAAATNIRTKINVLFSSQLFESGSYVLKAGSKKLAT